jgi:hypothetical protein
MLNKSICFWNVSYPTITMDPYLSDVICQFIGLYAKSRRHQLHTLSSLHGQINNYFTFATSHDAIFHVKNTTAGTSWLHYYKYLRAPNLRIHSPPSTTDSCICHGSHSHRLILPGCLITRLTPHLTRTTKPWIRETIGWAPKRGLK